MITLSDNIFTSLPLPEDARIVNAILDGGNVIVETIPQYLDRVDMFSRYLGMEVIVYTQSGIYEANDCIERINNKQITYQTYVFLEGIADENFVVVEQSSGGSPFPLTIDSNSINEITELGHTHELGNISIDKVVGSYKVKYGALYNGYCATDSRNIAPVGFHVPSKVEWATLAMIIDPSFNPYSPDYDQYSINGGRLKEVGFDHWSSPNTDADNSSGFTAVGSGYRSLTGSFADIGNGARFLVFDTESLHTILYYDSNNFAVWNIYMGGNSEANSLRFIADSGTPTQAIGNDGKIYPCVTIGGQTWTAVNSNETKYRNGDYVHGFEGGVYNSIPNEVWAGLTTEAGCYYDDNPENGGVETPLPELLHNAVTIDLDSIDNLSIDENQILHFIPQTLAPDSLPNTITSSTINEIVDGKHTHKLENISIDNIVKKGEGLGALYNWWAANDIRKISSSDSWVVTPNNIINDLITWFGGDSDGSILGGKLKEIGTTHWNTPNTGATNELKFNAVGAGEREGYGGGFYSKFTLNHIWIEGQPLAGAVAYIRFESYDSYISTQINLIEDHGKKNGWSIRLCNPSTLLSEGQIGSYTGNDGKIYPTIVINGVEWLAQNLNETKYRNGDYIHGFEGGVYTPISNEDWAALTTEGMCYYDDDESNGGGKKTLSDIITDIKHDDTKSIKGGAVGEHNHLTDEELAKVQSLGTISSKDFWVGTQTEYDLIDPKDSNTIYYVEEVIE